MADPVADPPIPVRDEAGGEEEDYESDVYEVEDDGEDEEYNQGDEDDEEDDEDDDDEPQGQVCAFPL